jgi:dUTPase
MSIKFTLVRDVKMPNRGHSTDAGIDFFVPRFDKKMVQDLKEKNSLIWKKDDDTYTVSSGTFIANGTVTISQEERKYKLDISDKNDSIIKYNEEEGKSYIPLLPGARINIPSGVHCKMEKDDRVLIGFNKSGIASKLGLVFGAHVIDSGYQGEIHLNLINTSTKVVRIYEDMKILQFVEMPIFLSNIEQVTDLSELYPEKTKRGEGGFGSTGN